MEVETGQEGDSSGSTEAEQAAPATPALEVDEVAQARREGWEEVNLKGNGDCAFRCIAVAREFSDCGKVLSEKESKNKGAVVRVDTVSHMRASPGTLSSLLRC